MSGHNYETRYGMTVCKRCGYVRNSDGYVVGAAARSSCPGTLPKVETRRELEGTPPGTRLSYLTADGVVVVMGAPDDEHSCDAMGCGSVSDHVVERINVRELREQIAILVEERDELRSALQSIVSVTESEAREAGYALAAADGIAARGKLGKGDRP